MTDSVSTSELQARVARLEAFTRATGLSTSSPLPTTQSSAFFRTPGTPWAYSGLESKTASADWRAARNAQTGVGGVSVSRSGLNGGNWSRSSKIATSIPDGASCAAALTSAVFEEARRKLPEIASTRIALTSFICASDPADAERSITRKREWPRGGHSHAITYEHDEPTILIDFTVNVAIPPIVSPATPVTDTLWPTCLPRSTDVL